MRGRDPIKEAKVRSKAIELIVKHGIEHFTVGKLARECGLSVGTLYIYFKDKDDLITRVAGEKFAEMNSAILKDFDPNSRFEEGLRLQWRNRADYMMANPQVFLLFDLLRSSSYQSCVFAVNGIGFRETMQRFKQIAVNRGEIDPMPFETYWSVAFGPLYNLLRFHNEGKSFGDRPFVLTEEILWSTFDKVIKALKK